MSKKVKLYIRFDLFCKEYKEKMGLKKFSKRDASKLLDRQAKSICQLENGMQSVPRIIEDLHLMSLHTGKSMDYYIGKKEI